MAWGLTTLRPLTGPPPSPAMIVQLVGALPAPPEEARPGSEARAAPDRLQPPAVNPRFVPPDLASVPAPAGDTRAPAVPAETPPSAPRSPAPSAEERLADYRRRLWLHLAAHAPAAPAGSGTVSVVFGVDARGALLFARLARSSGRPAFDRAGLASVRAAVPLPAPPEGIDPADLVFTVPIRAASL